MNSFRFLKIVFISTYRSIPMDFFWKILFPFTFVSLKLFLGNENNFCSELVANDNSVRVPMAIRPSDVQPDIFFNIYSQP